MFLSPAEVEAVMGEFSAIHAEELLLVHLCCKRWFHIQKPRLGIRRLYHRPPYVRGELEIGYINAAANYPGKNLNSNS